MSVSVFHLMIFVVFGGLIFAAHSAICAHEREQCRLALQKKVDKAAEILKVLVGEPFRFDEHSHCDGAVMRAVQARRFDAYRAVHVRFAMDNVARAQSYLRRAEVGRRIEAVYHLDVVEEELALAGWQLGTGTCVFEPDYVGPQSVRISGRRPNSPAPAN